MMDPIDTCDHCGEVTEVQFIQSERVCQECVKFLQEAVGNTDESLDNEAEMLEEVGL